MKTIYLGQRAIDSRTYGDDDIVLLMPSSSSIGSVNFIKGKEVYRAHAWDGVKQCQKHFYTREMKTRFKAGTGECFASPEEALNAAKTWMETNSKNVRYENIAVKASEITDEVANKFYYVEPCVEYPAEEVPLDPYYLGLWLGDGTSSSTEITTVNPEIMNYLQNLAIDNGCTITLSKKKVPGHCLVYKIGRANPLRSALRELNVLKNKHIPEIYLHNSRDVRMKLLAGLIDTDGTSAGVGMYDITQKSKRLAEDIVKLGCSLGMYSVMVERQCTATNSANPTPGTYYRVMIYMCTHVEIPLLLDYKKTSAPFTGVSSLSKKEGKTKQTWGEETVEKLKEVIEKYMDMFGRVPWKDIVNNEEYFKLFPPNSLRTKARDVAIFKELSKAKEEHVEKLKQLLVQILPKYRKGKHTNWTALFENEPDFEGMTEQQMRTIMTRFTPDEKKVLNL